MSIEHRSYKFKLISMVLNDNYGMRFSEKYASINMYVYCICT
jgi:hypothetical protein